MAAERDEKIWNSLELKANTHFNGEETDFSVGNILDDSLERNICCDLVLVGPVLDGYIKRMGKSFQNKLSRKGTGKQQANLLYFPWQFFSRFSKLAKGYGAEITVKRGRKEIKSISVKFNTQVSAQKIWHPRRMKGGCNYLAHRKFQKVAGSKDVVCCGTGRIVVTNNTPLVITYNNKQETCTSSFYIQRYYQLMPHYNSS